MERVDSVQILRAFAAITVVMCHAGQTGAIYSMAPSVFAEPAKYLVFGVDLFFVISGFIIYYTSTLNDLSPVEFIFRRLRRIVPLYWLLTVVFFGCVMLLPGLKSSTFTDWPKFFASLGFISFVGWVYPVIYPGWTLEYEMIFYTLTFIGMVVSRKKPWVIVALVICFAASARLLIGKHPDRALLFLTDSVTLSFLVGVLAGQSLVEGRVGRLELLFLAVGLVVVLNQHPMQRFLYAGIPSAVIVYLAVKYNKNGMWPKLLLKLGDASYAIYLVHVFLIAIVGKVFRAAWPGHDPELLVVVMTLTPILIGLALHQWVELPIAIRLSGKRFEGVSVGSGLTAH